MYSRDEIKALTDKVLSMVKADAAEISFDGGERSATRWANSSITVNLVQYDQQLSLNVRHGQKQGSSSTREFDDESLKAMVAAPLSIELPDLKDSRMALNSLRRGKDKR